MTASAVVFSAAATKVSRSAGAIASPSVPMRSASVETYTLLRGAARRNPSICSIVRSRMKRGATMPAATDARASPRPWSMSGATAASRAR